MITQTDLSVILPEYNPNIIRALLGIRFDNRPILALNPGEVLIETAYASCNPSDIAFIRGGYNIKKPLPAVPGFEGSGKIIDAAKDVLNLVGKQVSCFVQADADGTWASHFIARATDCIVLKEGMDMKQAACLSINPLTALGMYEYAVSQGCKSFIVNAAGGQVPAFMSALAKLDGIEVIQIVRKSEQLTKMKASGMTYVLNETSGNFEDELKQICNLLKPALAFDAVGGELSSKLLKALPFEGKLVVYGALSNPRLEGLGAMDIIFHGKSIRGFNLNEWVFSMEKEAFFEKTEKAQNLILDGTWKTQIQEVFSLSDLVKGIRAYIQSMSAGKVLFRP